MKLSKRGLDKREDADIAVLDRFDDIYKAQCNAISRRLLGNKDSAESRAITYFTAEELEAVRNLAGTIGLSISALIRITMVTLAAAGLPARDSYHPDPRVSNEPYNTLFDTASNKLSDKLSNTDKPKPNAQPKGTKKHETYTDRQDTTDRPSYPDDTYV